MPFAALGGAVHPQHAGLPEAQRLQHLVAVHHTLRRVRLRLEVCLAVGNGAGGAAEEDAACLRRRPRADCAAVLQADCVLLLQRLRAAAMPGPRAAPARRHARVPRLRRFPAEDTVLLVIHRALSLQRHRVDLLLGHVLLENLLALVLHQTLLALPFGVGELLGPLLCNVGVRGSGGVVGAHELADVERLCWGVDGLGLVPGDILLLLLAQLRAVEDLLERLVEIAVVGRSGEDLGGAKSDHGGQLFLGELLALGGGQLASHHCGEIELALCTQDHALLHSALADKTEDLHVARLTNAVRPVLCLEVHLWVPVAVHVHHSVGAGERNAEAAGARGEEVEKDARRGVVELFDVHLPPYAWRRAVQPAVGVAAERAVVLKEVEHAREEREDQYLAALCLEAREDLVQHRQLAARPHKVLVQLRAGRLRAREKVGVVAALA
mmetsp:Transcript_5134/g.19039  ORF Transcript_5134/g.19039 Transcript_5134/m.19039 type:complete len:438 (+) Transcript_5134:1596-2909(+)